MLHFLLPRFAMPYRRTANVVRKLVARHDAILAAACEAAAEGGMAAVQIAPVAARAGSAGARRRAGRGPHRLARARRPRRSRQSPRAGPDAHAVCVARARRRRRARARPRRADGDAAAEREILGIKKRSEAGHCSVAAAIHSVTARSAVPGLPLWMWASNTASCASADVPEPTMARQRLISAVQPSAAASAAVSQITRSTISATVMAPSSAAKVA